MPRDLARSLQRSLSHLKPGPIKGGEHGSPIPTHFRPNPKFVQVKDRLAFWHIAPNDKVTLIRGPQELKGTTGTVERVDRETSRVYLRENQFAAKKRQQSQYPGEAFSPDAPTQIIYLPRSYHVDNFRLQVEDQGLTHTVTRMKRSAITWDRNYRRFSWKRYGLVTSLIAPETKDDLGNIITKAHTGWLQIAWPREDVEAPPKAGQFDTKGPSAAKISFLPSFAKLKNHLETPIARQLELKNILIPELRLPNLDLNGGYFSRAVRTKRFNKQKEETMEISKAQRKAQRKQSAMAQIELA